MGFAGELSSRSVVHSLVVAGILVVGAGGSPVAGQTVPAARLQPPSVTRSSQETAAAPAGETSREPGAGKAEAATEAAKRAQAEQLKRQKIDLVAKHSFQLNAMSLLNTWIEDAGWSGRKGTLQRRLVEQQRRHRSTTKNPLSQFRDELKRLSDAVTTRRWKEVRQILAGWDKEVAETAYTSLLSDIDDDSNSNNPIRQMLLLGQNGPEDPFGGMSNRSSAQGSYQWRASTDFDRAFLTTEDVIGLLFASPTAMDAELAIAFGDAVGTAVSQGENKDVFARQLKSLIDKPRAEQPKWIDKPLVVDILLGAGLNEAAREFMPALDDALTRKDSRALEQWLSLLELELNQGKFDDVPADIWSVIRFLTEEDGTSDESRERAYRIGIALTSRTEDEAGRRWLAGALKKKRDEAAPVIAGLAMFYRIFAPRLPRDPEARKGMLRVQKIGAEVLLSQGNEAAESWRRVLDIMARSWVAEATLAYSHTTSGRRMLRYDSYGNPYYIDSTQFTGNRQRQPDPILIDDLVELMPGDAWQAVLPEGTRPNLAAMRARLLLKVGDEEPAYEVIRGLVDDYPRLAKELVDEFLERWRENHQLNKADVPRNPFMVMYGFNQRFEGIPLTRSKQERNMAELGEWVARLRRLDVGPLDEDRLVAAFTDAHSVAEVYKLETIEKVFGPIDKLPAKLVARLIDQMRGNLANVWRDPRVQQAMKTKRRKKDIEREVERGYRTALEVADGALQRHASSWRVLAARAAIVIDRLNYRKEIKKSDSTFAEEHGKAMAAFRRAAELYVEQVDRLPKKEWTVEPFHRWFYASLGSADIRGIGPDKVVDRAQIPQIASLLRSMAGRAGKWHRAQFASSLYTRMSSVNPGSKFLYLKAGFDIVGDHKLAREARRLYDYYKDLVREIRFQTVLDTESVQVGSDEPFGVFVQFYHTKEIERETGGFAKYTTNQNRYYYAYNYGRPLADYRDKFEEGARAALEKDFEVLSITYNSKEAHSKAVDEPGWRVTPYAYILLKAKGPQVDHLPPLKIDLDFSDTSGYVVLPIESERLPIDATRRAAHPPIPTELSIVQTLDERQASSGKLVLEVKATAHGRIPPLDALLKLDPPGFHQTAVDDHGVSATEFVADSDETAVLCERLWTVEFAADPTGEGPIPDRFVMGEPIVPVKETLYQRFVDEDLVPVDRVVPLEADYAEASLPWAWIVLAGIGGVILLTIVVGAWRVVRRRRHDVEPVVPLPDEITPFTLLGWLRHIDAAGLVRREAREELVRTIADLESKFFAESDGHDVDLTAVANRWSRRVST